MHSERGVKRGVAGLDGSDPTDGLRGRGEALTHFRRLPPELRARAGERGRGEEKVVFAVRDQGRHGSADVGAGVDGRQPLREHKLAVRLVLVLFQELSCRWKLKVPACHATRCQYGSGCRRRHYHPSGLTGRRVLG